MTSRKKIQALTKAAKSLHCSILLKTGRPPGVMLVESASESDGQAQKAVESWVDVVKRLRYKDYQLMRMERVEVGCLKVDVGSVREFAEMKEFGKYMEKCGMWEWWREHMGFTKFGL